ncbi:MAG: hypothetical protein CVV04_00515 [Firmicutes bacterium HGW-Firmicutes-9]|jgi:hypothetical protein|nr:MAG: hypothetical protein CVV04_00515 [Firmicutes bacterium HGW-Firmicutes-9]
MSKILDWIKKHIWQTAMIGFSLFFLPLILVHIAYRIPAISPWFASTWQAGELITYIAGFEAFLGTVVLGLVAIRQNDKSNELNERMLNAEEKRDLFERQPIIDVLDCSISQGLSRDFFESEAIKNSKCYVEGEEDGFNIETLDTSYICISYNLCNISNQIIRCTHSRTSIRDQFHGFSCRELKVFLFHCPNALGELQPNIPQKINFLFREDALKEADLGIIKNCFELTNKIGEKYEAVFDFLFSYYLDSVDRFGYSIRRLD